jgi:predicted nicotinamide N-methyase
MLPPGATSLGTSANAFIRANTALAHPPLVPELTLHLASDAMALWEMTETKLARAGVPPPFWAFAWAGGQALARFVIDTPAAVGGRRVLDVAAGGGIAGLAALWASAAHVTANEIDSFAAAAIALNAEANNLSFGLEITTRDMLDEPALANDGGPLWDVVLAGDVCYEQPMAGRMLAWLRRHADAGALVLIGDPGRAYAPADAIQEVGRYAVPTPLALEDKVVRDTAVLRVISTGCPAPVNPKSPPR